MVGKAFGIISDAEKFYFLECQLNGNGKPSFKLLNSLVVNYGSRCMEETVADVLGHIGWLLEEAEKLEEAENPESSLPNVKKQQTY